MSFLEIDNVSKGFGYGDKRIDVLHNIQLQMDKGEFVAIVGFSGAGKSTLLSIVAGLLAPDRGSVSVGGRKVTGPGRDRGVVFQNYSLLPWLTVYENIALATDQVFPTWSAEERRIHTEKCIELVNLTPARAKKPGQLSGGMRQRVSVARALAMDPEVLLMDEPLGALDALTRATVQDEIARIWRQSRKTVVLITNDVDEGILLADRIVPLSAGPGAVLGPSFAIDIERPRDRKALNHDPRFKAIRKGVIEYLLESSAKKRGAKALSPAVAVEAPTREAVSMEMST
jgi:nitrate/nitrite transport system ATP-binding protein